MPSICQAWDLLSNVLIGFVRKRSEQCLAEAITDTNYADLSLLANTPAQSLLHSLKQAAKTQIRRSLRLNQDGAISSLNLTFNKDFAPSEISTPVHISVARSHLLKVMSSCT